MDTDWKTISKSMWFVHKQKCFPFHPIAKVGREGRHATSLTTYTSNTIIPKDSPMFTPMPCLGGFKNATFVDANTTMKSMQIWKCLSMALYFGNQCGVGEVPQGAIKFNSFPKTKHVDCGIG